MRTLSDKSSRNGICRWEDEACTSGVAESRLCRLSASLHLAWHKIAQTKHDLYSRNLREIVGGGKPRAYRVSEELPPADSTNMSCFPRTFDLVSIQPMPELSQCDGIMISAKPTLQTGREHNHQLALERKNETARPSCHKSATYATRTV